MASATTPTFDGYMDDFASARSDALRVIDAYDQCADRGTRAFFVCVPADANMSFQLTDCVIQPGKREELVVEARSAIEEVERYVRSCA